MPSQLEPRIGRQLHHLGRGQVTRVLDRFKICSVLGPVIFHTQYAARFEHLVKRTEGGRRSACFHPVMHVAERQYGIRRSRLAEHRRLGIELDDLGLAVTRRVCGELVFQVLLGRARISAGAGGLHGGDVLPVILEQW